MLILDEEKSIFHTKGKRLDLKVSSNLTYSRKHRKPVVENLSSQTVWV